MRTIAFAIVAVLLVTPALAQPMPCQQPHAATVERFAAAGWIIHDEIVLDGFESDHLFVVEAPNGVVIVAPIVKGCVMPYSMPIGHVAVPKGVPT